MKKLLILLISVLTFSCSPPDTDYLFYNFVGSWKLIEVYENDILEEQIVSDCEYEDLLTFNSDGTFTNQNYDYIDTACELGELTNGTYYENEDSTVRTEIGSEVKITMFESITIDKFQFIETELEDGITYEIRKVYQRQ